MTSVENTNSEYCSPGLFIVFEGIDRSGKSSQSLRLYEKLKQEGHKAHLLRFPNRSSAIGSVIDSYLNALPHEVDGTENAKSRLPKEAIHLLFSSNRWESMPTIESSINRGEIVIADRYAFSGVAYSSGAEGLDRLWCMSADKGLRQPDCVVYLDINPKDAANRKNYGGEVYEALSIQERVYESYTFFKSLPYWNAIDATMHIDAIERVIWEKIDSLIKSKTGSNNNSSENGTSGGNSHKKNPVPVLW